MEGEQTFRNIRIQSDSIGLIKNLEKLCYSYRAHEYIPLGAWDAIDKLTLLRQPVDVYEVKHYETFRSVVEMCKAGGINFATMCTANTNMALNNLRQEGKITTTGSYEDGAYFKLTNDQRIAVDKMAEDICLSVRFLSLSSNRLHSASKQELRNDMVKGEDKYPRTIVATLRILQYHDLPGKQVNDRKSKKSRSEKAFAQRDDDDGTSNQQKGRVC